MSSAPWFRLYHRMIDDEKMRLLAFEDRWHFIAILCLKADGLLDEEESTLKQRKIAVKLGVQLRELDEIKRRLSEVGLVNDDMQPIAWDDLQYKSDTSTDRVRKYREKTKPKKSETECNVSRNVSVTAQDTDTDTDITSSLRSDVSVKPDFETEFEQQFWPVFPRRAGKGQALKAFKAARKRVDLETILEGARRYADERRGENPEYTKHPATWLNGQCWTDEPVPKFAPSQQTTAKPLKQTAATIFTNRARQMGILKDEPDSPQTGLRQEGHGSRYGDVLDLTCEPSSEGSGQRGSGRSSLFHRP
ncbi:hypothetical protein [Ochrobactrum sp. MC-1LL]|uniref:hypothetical protein n=1 Tax=Ochrobactrum sp. MC-1LL TaxID=2735351 RepID=UPI0014384A73|nr:hypothetical protein [Ochrobactrum sp. MC-1LL]NKE77556.1 hypothetical protein [Ochrobactrum sp. MC-1LL]